MRPKGTELVNTGDIDEVSEDIRDSMRVLPNLNRSMCIASVITREASLTPPGDATD